MKKALLRTIGSICFTVLLLAAVSINAKSAFLDFSGDVSVPKSLVDATYRRPAMLPEVPKSRTTVQNIPALDAIRAATAEATSSIGGELNVNGILVPTDIAAPFSLTQTSTCPTGIATITYTGDSLQHFIVPTGVTSISIRVIGANGGAVPGVSAGGKGAIMQGTFPIAGGQTLTILTGRKGDDDQEAGDNTGGGGGGSFVFSSSTLTAANLLVAAGGGGGGGYGVSPSGQANIDANVTQNGNYGGNVANGGQGSDGGVTKGGQTAKGEFYGGAGGAGIASDGYIDDPTLSSFVGLSPAHLGYGGTGGNENGGYGGGGGVIGGGGGGGGGYSGGGGGALDENGASAYGGGGGSFLLPGATNISSSPGTGNTDGTGNGIVVITWNTGASAITASSNSPVNVGGTVNLSSTAGFTSYSWTGPNSFTSNTANPSITGATLAAAGTYTVIGTNVFGCRATSSTNVVINSSAPLIPGTIGSDQSICSGSTPAALTSTTDASGGTGTISYQWQSSTDNTNFANIPGATSATYSPGALTQTTYYRRGASTSTDASVYTGSVKITVNTPPTLTNTSVNVSCLNGNDGSIDITVAGGTAPFTYVWSNSATTEDLSGLAAGTYTVTVRDAKGCTVSTSVTIRQPSSAVSFTTTNTNIGCYGASTGAIAVSAAGGNGSYTYSINGGTYQAGSTFSNLAAATYTITVKDGLGCTQSNNVTLTQPSAALTLTTASVTNVLCSGASTGSITVSAAGGTSPYLYSIDGGTNQSSATFSALTGRTHTVTVQDASGCTTSIPVSVTQPSSPLQAFAAASDVTCYNGNNGSISLSVVGGTRPYSISLNGGAGQTSPNFSGLTAGNYTIVVTDANGCTYTTSATVNQPASDVSFTTANTNISCYGSSRGAIAVTAAGGNGTYTYSINGGTYQSGAGFTGLAAGTYIITVKDGNGCIASNSIMLTQPAAAVTFTTSTTDITCYGGLNGTITINATGGTGAYSYSVDGTNYQPGSLFGSLAPGTYTVYVQDANGCSASGSVTLRQPSAPVSFTTTSTNPLCYGSSTGAISVTAAGGNGSYTYSLNSGAYQAGSNFAGLGAGTYLVSVKDGNSCVASTTITLTQPAAAVSLTAASVTNVLCSGASTGSITVSAAGGTSPYLYSIDGGTDQSSATFNGLSGRTHTVTVQDASGCTTSIPVSVTQPSSPVQAFASASDVTCYNANTGSISLAVVGGTRPYSISLNGGAGQASPNFSGLAAGSYTIVVTDANGCTYTTSATVNQPASAVSFTTSVTDVKCYGSLTGTIAVTATGGTSGYTYSIDNGTYQSNATFAGLAAGSHAISVKDANGCMKSGFVTVSQPSSALTFTSNIGQISCYGDANGAISLTASGGTPSYNYSIDGGTTYQSSSNFYSLAAGSYAIRIQDANGCLTGGTATITQPATAVAFTTTTVSPACYGNSNGSITVNATGGTAPYQYSINFGSLKTNPTFSNLAAGTYKIVVRDNLGCQMLQNVVVNQPPQLSFTGGATNASCPTAADGTITINANGGTAPYSYSKDNGATFQSSNTFTGLSTGVTYMIVVKDASGCTTVGQTAGVGANAAPTISGASQVCKNSTISLTGSGTPAATNAWASSDASIATVNNSGVVTGIGAGIATITYTNSAGCSTTLKVNVSNPPGVNILPNTDQSICAGSSTTLSANTEPGLTYVWTPGNQTSSSITVSAAGTYTLTGTDPNTHCSSSASVSVTVNALPNAPAGTDGSSCAPNGATISATPGAGETIDWYTTSTGGTAVMANSNTFTTNVSGVYYAEARNTTTGCVSASRTAVTATVNPLPNTTVTAGGPTDLCYGGSVVLNAPAGTGYTYQWHLNANDITGATGATYTATQAGVYTVTVSTPQNCSATTNDGGVTVTVALQPHISTGMTAFCPGGSSTLQADAVTGVAYQWQKDNIDIAGAISSSYTATEAGSYTLVETKTSGSLCSATSNAIVISVYTAPATPTISGPLSFCVINGSGSATLTSSAANSYHWSNNPITQSITVLSSGTFTVTIADANGCQASSAPFTVTAIPVNTPRITAGGPTSVCPDKTVALHASGNDAQYQWFKDDNIIPGATGADYTAIVSGTYTVEQVSGDCVSPASNGVPVTIADNTAPAVPTLADATGQCSVTVTPPVTTDNCAGAVTGTTNDPLTYTAQGTYVIHWSFNDGNGNTSTATQNVIVKDVTAPHVTCPSNITLHASSTENGYGATAIYTATATDNCGIPTVLYSIPSGSFFTVGTHTVNVTAVDGNRNTDACSFTVTVIAPEINITGNNTDIVDGDNTPSTTDNTDFGHTLPGAPITKTFTIQNQGNDDLHVSGIAISGADASSFTLGAFSAITLAPGATTTFTVTFQSGTVGVKNATVTVSNDDYDESSYDYAIQATVDCLAPTFAACPSNITQNTDASLCSAVVNYTATIAANTNPAATVTYTLTGATTGTGTGTGTGSIFNKGVTTVTITATNACGTSTCSFTVTVVDNESPVIVNLPANISTSNDAGVCGAAVTWSTVGATDNCPGVTLTSDHASGEVYPVGTTTVTYTATDLAGHSVNGSFTVTVNDTEKPTFICPSDITVTANTTNTGGQAGYNATYSVTASDNCGVQSTVYSIPSGSFFPIGDTPVTVTVTDKNGNQQTCTFHVIVNCVTPTFTTCPSDKTVSTDAGLCSAVVNYTATLDAATNPAATITYTLTGATTGSGDGTGTGSTFNKGVTTVTITASNLCGTATCSFKVTVVDNENPIIVNLPANISKSNDAGVCGAVVTWSTVGATDNCPGVILISNHASGEVYPVGTTTVTYTATDLAGHSVNGSFTVTVNDTEKPTFICPSDITVTANTTNTGGQAGYNATYSVTASDNCGVQSTVYSIPSGSFFPIGDTPVTLTVTDKNGNQQTCTFHVIVNCVTPTFTTCPSDKTVSTDAGLCSAVVNYTATLDAATNPAATVTYTLTGATTGSGDGTGTGSTFNKGVTTVTITASNLCGTATCSFKVTVVDNENPIIVNLPVNISKSNDAGVCGGVVTWSTVSATDNCPGVTLTSNHVSGEVYPVGTTTVTYTATDLAGHSVNGSFTVTVNDTEKPTFICPSNITVTANTTNTGGQAGYNATYSVTASDNCGVQSTVYSIPSGSFFPIGDTPVTVTVTDKNGNQQTCTFHVIVNCVTPTFTTCPSDKTVSTDAGLCSAVVTYTSAATGTPAASCSYTFSGATTGSGTGNGSGKVFNKGVTTVTITASNLCGTATCSFKITVADNENPIIVNLPANISKSNDAGVCGAVVTWPVVSATDNCPGVILISNHASGEVYPVGTTTVTYTATDLAGHSVNGSFTVTVNDTEKPTFICPSDITVTANTTNTGGQAGYNATYSVTASDNCGVQSTVYSIPSGSFFPIGDTPVTVTVTDKNGNQQTCTFHVIVNCVTPTFTTCPSDKTVSTDLGLCSAVVTYTSAATGTPAASCSYAFSGATTGSGTGNGSGKVFNKGVTTVTITASNLCGTATCSFKVTVVDNENPIIVNLPANISKSNDAGVCGAVVTWSTVSATDNCPGVTLTSNHASGEVYPVGTTTVTYTATDLAGHSVNGSFTVTVNDTEKPTFICPSNITVTANTTNTGGQAGYNATYSVTASDNCGVQSTVYSIPSGSFFPIGDTPVTVTVTDKNGNQQTCTFHVIVNCVTPTFTTCPSDKTVSTDAGLCSAVVTYTSAATGTPAASCSYTFSGATTGSGTGNGSGKVFNKGVTTVTITASNLCGTATCSFKITVADNENPIIVNLPANISKSNDAGVCGAVVTWPVVSATDNCPGVILISNHASGEVYPVGTTTVTYTATDLAGHSVNGSFTVTVNDTEKPTFICPSNITVTANTTNTGGQAGYNATYSVTASDNCGVQSTVYSIPSGSFFPIGDTPVTVTVTDKNGNQQTCTFHVIVNCVTPTFTTCPSDKTVSTDLGLCSAVVTYTSAATGTPAASCSYAFSGATTGSGTGNGSGKVFNKGVTTVTITASNLCGTATCSFKVTVVDNENPIIVNLPANISKSNDAGVCGAVVTWSTVSATDNCPGVTLTSNHASGEVYPVGTTTVTYTATDLAGHSVNGSFTVTVNDTEKPTFICPSDITVTANTTNTGGQAGYNATYSVTASDNCGVQSTVYSIPSGSFFPIGDTPVTVTVTDKNGNQQTCTFHVIVNCVTPTFTTCPSDKTVSTDLGLCSAVVTYTSAATGTPAASCSYAFSGATTGSGTGNGSGKVFNKGVTTVTITASNLCGTATCSFKVTVVDNENPIIVNLPANISKSNDAGVCGAVVTWSTVSATDNCPGVTLTSNHASGEVYPVGTTTVTYTATDLAGHSVNGSFTVTVNDTEKPTFICPSDITVTANTTNTGGQAGYNATYSVTASDNCGVQSTVYSIPSGSFFPIGDTPVTVTVTDKNGNQQTCTFHVIVNCVTPTFTTCPSDKTVSTDLGLCSAVVTYTSAATGTPAASCSYAFSGATTGSGTGNGSGKVFNKGVTTVTITASNLCGTATCSFKVTVVDNENPIIVNLPANISKSNDAGKCGAVTTWAVPTATDNCPGVTLTSNHASGELFPVGTTTVTYTATDAAGHAVTGSFTVTVADKEAPAIQCPANITLACGLATTPANAGTATATDNCSAGITITYTDAVTGNITTRTWKATDAAGNSSTCTQTITQGGPFVSTIASVPTSSVYTGAGIPSTSLFIGYGAQSTNLQVNVPAGSTYTYAWSGADIAMLSSSTSASPVFTPTHGGTYTFIVNVTNALGCKSTTSVTICVTDIRVFASVTPNDDDHQCMCNHQAHSAYDCPHQGHNHTCDHKAHTAYNCPHRNTNDKDDDNQKDCDHSAHYSWNCPHKGHNHTCNHQAHSSSNCPHNKSTDQTVCNHQAHSSTDCSHSGHNHASCNHRAHSAADCPHNGGHGGTDDNDNTGKVYICHTPVGSYSNATMTVSVNDVAAHLANHPGDRLGSCNQAPCTGYTDTSKPVISCADNATIAYGTSVSPVVTGSPEADDNSGDVNITYADATNKGSNAAAASYYNYTITRTWKAADLAGNYSTCAQTILVQDIIKPVITVPGSVTVSCGATDPSVTGAATATDNASPVTITYTDVVSGNRITRTWKAADVSGNYVTGTQVITISDTVKPVLTEPNDITVGCGTSTLPAATGMATATDNCSAVVITYSDAVSGNTITRTWKATDASGNYDMDVQIITIVDNTKPVINTPANITISCGASTAPASCGGSATATDNCSTPAVSYSDATSGNVITRTWKATDASGNYSTGVQTITVVDNVKPVLYVPSNITVNCGSSTTPSGCGSSATATDNCSTPTVSYTDVVSGNVITRTWKATDAAGNYTTGNQTITIVDKVKPVLTEPNDITISCGSSTLPSATGNATATDNCSTVTITYSDVVSGNKITRTWVATDASGNYDTDIQIITLVDNTKPVISAPANVTISCGTSSAPAATGTATATDNCSTPTVTYSDVTSGNLITRTWKATDASGNYATAVQTITSVDNVKPVLNVPANITVNCGSSTTPSGCGSAATATDNCSTPVVTYADAISGSVITRTWKATDATGNYTTGVQTITIVDNTKPVITAPNDITISCGGSTVPSSCGSATATDNCSTPVVTYSDVTSGNKITRTWKATDAAGNYSTDTQIITVVDNTKPVISDVADVTVNCNASTLPAATGTATATDNCSTPAVSYSDVTSGNVITRTWKATDASGNYSTTTQLITVGSAFTASVTSVPTNSTYTGGVSTNLYLGYGAQSTTLAMCSLPSAGSPYTYKWTGTTGMLNSTTAASPVFTPSTFGYYTFTVTVTNKYGCTSTGTISICVTDIRVAGTNGAKVYVCHPVTSGHSTTYQTLQVAISQVASHVGNNTCGGGGNDRLGSCDQSPCNTTVSNSTVGISSGMTKEGAGDQVATTEEDLKVTVMPNPTTTYFTLKLESKYETPVNMRVMDAQGRVIDAKSKIGANSTIQIGHNYTSGTYYAELIQGNTRKVVQMIKGRG